MRTFRNISIIFIGLLLGACASHLSYSEMAAVMPPPPADKGRIYFYRESAWLGAVLTPDILVNGKRAGMSDPGAFFYIDGTPGDYQVQCGAGDLSSASFSLAAGQLIYVRTRVGDTILKSTMVTEVVPAETAIPQIHGLPYHAP